MQNTRDEKARQDIRDRQLRHRIRDEQLNQNSLGGKNEKYVDMQTPRTVPGTVSEKNPKTQEQWIVEKRIFRIKTSI